MLPELGATDTTGPNITMQPTGTHRGELRQCHWYAGAVRGHPGVLRLRSGLADIPGRQRHEDHLPGRAAPGVLVRIDESASLAATTRRYAAKAPIDREPGTRFGQLLDRLAGLFQ